VKGGSLDPALGRALNKTLELRREGDYDLASPDADDVRTAVQNAEALLQAISQVCAPDDGV
jgi:uncharacterized protein (UPF0332 family)